MFCYAYFYLYLQYVYVFTFFIYLFFLFCGKNYKNVVYYLNNTAGRVVATNAAYRGVVWYTSRDEIDGYFSEQPLKT